MNRVRSMENQSFAIDHCIPRSVEVEISRHALLSGDRIFIQRCSVDLQVRTSIKVGLLTDPILFLDIVRQGDRFWSRTRSKYFDRI